MRVAMIGVLVIAGGCETLFPLDGNRPSTDGAIDDLSCLVAGGTLELPLIADTYVDGTAATHGGESTLALGVGHAVLLRFQLRPLRVDDLIYSLELRRPLQADECGGSCGPCVSPPLASLSARVHATRPDWDEANVSSTERAAGMPWSTPTGPAGEDISGPFGGSTTADESQTLLTINFGPSPIDPSWTTEALSLLLEDETGQPALWTSKNNECAAPVPPRLIATCLPSALCGNGRVDASETCDDSNRTGGDGCDESCQLE